MNTFGIDLQPCDLLFTYNRRSVISKIIWAVSKWNTNYPLYEETSHVLMAISEKLVVESSKGGVLIKSKRSVFKRGRIITSCRVKLTANQKRIILKWSKEQSGMIGYAYSQLLSSLIGRLLNILKSKDIDPGMTCSEFIVNGFRRANVDLAVGILSHLVTPLDLYNSELIDTRVHQKT